MSVAWMLARFYILHIGLSALNLTYFACMSISPVKDDFQIFPELYACVLNFNEMKHVE